MFYGRNGLPSTRFAFWSGAAQIFDLFGLLDETDLPLDDAAARKADREALENDWRMVLGDLSRAWEITEPELRSEREQLV